MRLRLLAAATAVAMVSVPFIAGNAQSADSTVGATTFAPDFMCPGGTVLQTASSAGSYATSRAGVITSWRATAGAGAASTRTFKVGRLVNSQYTIVGSSAALSIPAGQTASQNVRIPVQKGDVIGFSYANQAVCARLTSPSSTVDTFVYSEADVAVGGTVPMQQQGYQFPVAAVVEADADGDGFGDTTQDQCPTDATTQGACKVVTPTPSPSPTAAPLPDINFGRATDGRMKAVKPGKKAKKTAKVTVVFAGNTSTVSYRCSVDGGVYVPCSSPFTPKLKKGTHTVTIQAVDAAGRVDPTPPTVLVKVTKAKKRR